MLSRLRTLCALTALALFSLPGMGQVGLTELPGTPGDDPVTVFYPSSSPVGPVRRGIDVLSRDARFGPLFDVGRVGVHGMSAGGHTGPRIKAAISAVPFAAVADMPQAGHGALLAPLPSDAQDRIGRLLADLPGFQPSELPALYQRIEAFFNKHLLP